MNMRLIVIFLLAILTVNCAESQTYYKNPAVLFGASKGYLVYLIRGNSISAGASDAASPTTSADVVFEWDQTNSILIDRATTELSTTGVGVGSPWKKFATDMHAATGKKIVLIACGLSGAEVFPNGGTNTHWAPHYDNAGAAVPGGTGSTLYTNSVTEVGQCLAYLNKASLDGILDIVGINDARGAATMANINLGFTDLYNSTNTDFPGVPIYASSVGIHETTTLDDRNAPIKKLQRVLADNRSYYHLVCNLSTLYPASMYRADNLHPTQTGCNKIGELYARYINYSESNKEVKQVWNSFLDPLSTAHKAAWKTWVEQMQSDGNWTLLEMFMPAIGTTMENVYCDVRYLGAALNSLFTFTANTSIRCSSTSVYRRINILPAYSWITATQNDFIVGTKLLTNHSGAGVTGYLFGGRSTSPTTEISVAQLAASLQYECNDVTATVSSTHTALADNTLYSAYRTSGTKGLYAGSTSLGTASVASTGIVKLPIFEGNRNNNTTPNAPLDVSIEYSFQAAYTGFDMAEFNTATETLLTALRIP